MDATPRILDLCLTLSTLSSTLTRQVDTLTRRVGVPLDCLVLSPALENLVDRQKDKAALLAQWRVLLLEPLETPIEAELLE